MNKQEKIGMEILSALTNLVKDAKGVLPVEGPASSEQVAAFFHIKPRTLQQWIADRQSFPRPVTLGKRVYFDANEVRAYWLKVKDQ